MLKNYLLVAFRNIKKYQGFATTNILGLSVGFACFILIAAYIIDEFQYDSFHINKENIYRVALERHFPDRHVNFPRVPLPMAEALLEDYAEVVEATRFYSDFEEVRVSYEDDVYFEDNYLGADAKFFSIFTIPFLEGNPKTALSHPNSVVLTEATKVKYFGNTPALGKLLTFGDSTEFMVTGVCKDISDKSHLEYDFITSLISYTDVYENSFWGSYYSFTYIQLKDGFNPRLLEEKLPEMVRQYIGPQIEQYLGKSYQEYLDAGNIHNYFLQPLASIHLNSNFEREIKANGNLSSLYLFATIGLFILLIAGINFINLSTAQSTKRAKEIGIRKALGSQKAHLVWQFLVETMLLSSIAMVFALVWVSFALPYFNDLAAKSITLNQFPLIPFSMALFSIATTVGMLAGLYPALYMASFQPVKILKGNLKQTTGKFSLRSTLVVVQFSISILLTLATVVVFSQMEFMKNQNLGFEKEQVLIIDRAHLLHNGYTTFKNELNGHQTVESVSYSYSIPGRVSDGGTFEAIGMEATERFLHNTIAVDYDFFRTYGVEVDKGRSFSRDIATDNTAAVMMNKATQKMVGWSDPIGSKLQPVIGPQREIIGVFKDFHYASLHEEISPLLIYVFNDEEINPEQSNLPPYISVRIKAGNNLASTIDYIKQKWTAQVFSDDLHYFFLDDEFDQLYRQEERFGNIFTAFSVLAIFIASIGVIGLSTFITEQRFKEIGIRKVLGASVQKILILLSYDFLKLVVLANLIVGPIAYFLMNNWLESYPFRMEIDIVHFVSIALASVILVLVTIGYHSLKAALVKPIQSIRNE